MRLVGYENLTLRAKYLIKKKEGVEIDCNGIAQGFTSDVLGRLLQSRGIRNFLVDVGGELVASGVNAQGQPWSVGIERPPVADSTGEPVQAILYLKDRRHRYQRKLPPFLRRRRNTVRAYHRSRTRSLHNNIIAVTVTAPDAITADAYDNALILLGVEKGFDSSWKNIQSCSWKSIIFSRMQNTGSWKDILPASSVKTIEAGIFQPAPPFAHVPFLMVYWIWNFSPILPVMC